MCNYCNDIKVFIEFLSLNIYKFIFVLITALAFGILCFVWYCIIILTIYIYGDRRVIWRCWCYLIWNMFLQRLPTIENNLRIYAACIFASSCTFAYICIMQGFILSQLVLAFVLIKYLGNYFTDFYWSIVAKQTNNWIIYLFAS